MHAWFSGSIDVNTYSNKEDGEKPKVDDCMYDYGGNTGLHIPKLRHPRLCRNLKHQARSQQHEQHHRYNHRSPIRHQLSTYAVPLCFNFWDWTN